MSRKKNSKCWFHKWIRNIFETDIDVCKECGQLRTYTYHSESKSITKCNHDSIKIARSQIQTCDKRLSNLYYLFTDGEKTLLTKSNVRKIERKEISRLNKAREFFIKYVGKEWINECHAPQKLRG